jgi:hypothetical protein
MKTLVRDEHLVKQDSPTVSTDVGMENDVREEHREKAKAPIDVTLQPPSKVTVASF